jgi:hypothetical protein
VKINDAFGVGVKRVFTLPVLPVDSCAKAGTAITAVAASAKETNNFFTSISFILFTPQTNF